MVGHQYVEISPVAKMVMRLHSSGKGSPQGTPVAFRGYNRTRAYTVQAVNTDGAHLLPNLSCASTSSWKGSPQRTSVVSCVAAFPSSCSCHTAGSAGTFSMTRLMDR